MVPDVDARTPRFLTVAFDVDSTLSSIEGIDWLAGRKGADVAERVAKLTAAAMTGDIALELVYGVRLSTVAPTRDDVAALARAYCTELAPGAKRCLAALRQNGVRVLIVSGGLRQAILEVAQELGVADSDVYGVPLAFSGDAYAGYDATSPLTQSAGKSELLASLAPTLPRPILHVGDGVTDAATRDVVDGFAAYTGFVTRDGVVARADFVVASFDALLDLVVGTQTQSLGA